MLARWRATRHPRIGDLCERIAAARLAATPLPALAASKKRADLAAWDDVEGQGEPLDFARLAASARGGTQEQVIAHVKALAKRDDPALAAAMLALLEKPPYAGVRSRGMLEVILEVIRGTRDRRAAGAARALGRRYLAIVSSGTGGLSQQLAALADELDALPQPPLAATDAAWCDELEAAYGKPVAGAVPAGAKTLAQLLDEVYANPADDAPRQIYADALLERGDPRGEWIALDLARARDALDAAGLARQRALATPGEIASWAYPLSNAGDVTFERGFPARIRLYRNAKDIVAARELATIHTITGIDAVAQKTALALFANPHTAHVRHVARFPTASALAKCCEVPRPWSSVGFACKAMPPPATFANLPALTDLAVTVEIGAKLEPDAFAIPSLRALDLRWRQCDGIVLPPRLEKLALHLDRLPALELEHLHALRDVEIGFHEGPGQLALPPAVTRLKLSAHSNSHVPVTSVLPALASVQLYGAITPAHFAPLAHARTVSISTSARVPGDAVAGFAHLDDLTMSAEPEGTPVLPATLTRLSWSALVPAQVHGPSLEAAALRFPAAHAELAAFLARMPRLRHLELDARTGVELDVAAIDAWADTIRESALTTFAIAFQPRAWGGRSRLDFTRDPDSGRLVVAEAANDPIGNAIVGRLSA